MDDERNRGGWRREGITLAMLRVKTKNSTAASGSSSTEVAATAADAATVNLPIESL